MVRASWGHSASGAVLWAALAAACGGGDKPSTQPAQPTGSFRTALISGASFSLLPGSATYKNIDLPPSGMLDVTVDWAGTNDINVYVTDNVCPGFADLRAGRCNLITKAESPTAKPEQLTFSTATAPGRIWSVWIYNNGVSAESGTMEVGVTTDRPIAATPTPAAPAPTSGGNPTAGLAPGPVVRYTIKVRSIGEKGDSAQRDPSQDAEGNWIVHPDEFVVFDSTQKNADGLLCQTKGLPVWSIDDPGQILTVLGSSNPFLLRVQFNRKGTVNIQASVDGVESNVLSMLSDRR
jgi:hypothetical protein